MRATFDAKALAGLQRSIDNHATGKSRKFWRKYRKGNARFRGVPMAGVRVVVHEWWQTEVDS